MSSIEYIKRIRKLLQQLGEQLYLPLRRTNFQIDTLDGGKDILGTGIKANKYIWYLDFYPDKVHCSSLLPGKYKIMDKGMVAYEDIPALIKAEELSS